MQKYTAFAMRNGCDFLFELFHHLHRILGYFQHANRKSKKDGYKIGDATRCSHGHTSESMVSESIACSNLSWFSMPQKNGQSFGFDYFVMTSSKLLAYVFSYFH